MEDGRNRVMIEGVEPEIDCGRFPVKRAVGGTVRVEADVFADGHDRVSAVLLYRRAGGSEWREVPMAALVNDRWHASFRVEELGRYEYSVVAWIDRFGTWQHDLRKRLEAGQEVGLDLAIGAAQIEAAAERCVGEPREVLRGYSASLREARDPRTAALLALSPELAAL
ncbi:MAG: DUF3416 domain-containing protein, partial [Deltaproteobacteria bacterium]|nr:DUF3416 domain-containing protein [Deltaproteobacteria bacterium]